MKLSELTYEKRSHLVWRLDHKTSCGLLTAMAVAKGKHGDLDLVEIFMVYGERTERSAKIHARKVINFAVDLHKAKALLPQETINKIVESRSIQC